jgi:hypothetical protein
MPSRFVFRCDFCDVEPDEETHRNLTSQLAELRSGEFVNMPPGGWLVWHGKGIYGPTRYACGEHRVALRTFVREHYGTIGWHPHARVLGNLPPEMVEQMAPERRERRTTPRQRKLWRQSGSRYSGGL